MPRRNVDEPWGNLTLRMVARESGQFDGIVFGKSEGIVAKVRGERSEAQASVRARLIEEASRQHPNWIGYEGAIAHFSKLYPNGFNDEQYIADEREYKLAAKSGLDESAPLDAARKGTGFGLAVLRAFRTTNLLSPYELMRVKDLLTSDQADSFVQGAATFATGDVAAGLVQMHRALAPYEAAKWTVVTYLPFLWRPEQHMFLKPEKTGLFADRIGHEFAYQYRPELNPEVYASLVDLATTTRAKTGHLGPRDLLDVQSFVWVVGTYTAGETAAR